MQVVKNILVSLFTTVDSKFNIDFEIFIIIVLDISAICRQRIHQITTVQNVIAASSIIEHLVPICACIGPIFHTLIIRIRTLVKCAQLNFLHTNHFGYTCVCTSQLR